MAANDLDPRAILATLGYSAAGTVTPVSGGRDTAIFRVEHRDSAYALRVFRPEQARASQGEMRAMQVAEAGDLPVPRVHAYGVHAGRPAMLLSWCAGRTVLDALVERPARAEPLGIAAGRTLARMHAIVVPVEYQDRSWLRWGAREPGDPLRPWLETAARHDRLLHLDYHPLNLLTDGEEITAVLDWANAHAGDPRADLARSITIARLDTGDLPREWRPAIRAFERGLRRGYVEQTGPLPEMARFHVWAGQAMLHDLAPRLASNPAQTTRIQRWVRLWKSLVRDSAPANRG
ncbi:MAG: phosphotransferase family protein [Vicinamibacterales bacterium]